VHVLAQGVACAIVRCTKNVAAQQKREYARRVQFSRKVGADPLVIVPSRVAPVAPESKRRPIMTTTTKKTGAKTTETKATVVAAAKPVEAARTAALEVADMNAATIAKASESVAQVAKAAVKSANAMVGSATPAPMSDMLKPFNAVQEQVRANAEKGIEQIRAHYASLKGTAENATDALEESMAAAHAGSRTFNMKVLELFRLQTNAGFAHMQALFTARTVGDAVKLQQDFARTQVEMLQAHAKELSDIAKRVASDVVEPVKESMVLPFKR
jgi:phasin